MGILDVASNNSIWRGYDYYEKKCVLEWCQVSDTVLEGVVKGNRQEPYYVRVDLAHPKKSECDCPHAEGTRKVCKHKMAVYFTAFPEEAKRLVQEAEEYEEEQERYYEEMEDALIAYVRKMKKAELQQALLQILFEGSEWQFNRFIEEHLHYWN